MSAHTFVMISKIVFVEYLRKSQPVVSISIHFLPKCKKRVISVIFFLFAELLLNFFYFYSFSLNLKIVGYMIVISNVKL
jgi:hypothetical protein